MKQYIKYRQQQGVVMIIALILMVVMSLTGVLAYRLSGMDALMSNNVRTKSMALQAAEAALSYCKEDVFSKRALKQVTSDVPTQGDTWMTISNWDDKNKVNVLDFTELGTLAGYNRGPECMIEDISAYVLATSAQSNAQQQPIVVYKITARGFSPGLVVGKDDKDSGWQKGGSQAWLQIMVSRVLA